MNDATSGVAELAKATGIALAEDDGAPVVRLSADLNQTALLLGQVATRLDLYKMNGEIVYFDEDHQMKPMTGRRLRTWINDHVVIASKFDKESGRPIAGTLTHDEAATILDCGNFRRGVRPLLAVNQVRLPVVRSSGEIELLPWGYDDEFQVYTIPGGIEYEADTSLEVAVRRLDEVDEGFPFSDRRSRSVQRAADLALFCKHLPGGQSLRPGFLWLGNKPGSGKSVLAKKGLYPVLGKVASAKMKKGEELDKELEAFARARVPYIFLDNVYGGIASASIDQMLTSTSSAGRAMGGHEIFEADNTALLVVTGNRLELNEDAARRFLVVDLFEPGEPDERKVTNRLDDDLMRTVEWRRRMLGSLWAVVKAWHAAGMPKGKVKLPTYEAYSELLGGIVVAAGYEEPFQKAIIPDAISPEKSEFAELVDLVLRDMGEAREKDFTVEELCCLARSAGLFQGKIGTKEEGKKMTIKEDGLKGEERTFAEDQGYMTPSQRSAWGKLVAKEAGGNPKGKSGVAVEFGKRAQARKATFTVRRLV